MREAQYKLIVDGARRHGASFPTQGDWLDFKAAIDRALEQVPAPVIPPVSHLSLTQRVAMEIIGHEAIVPEAYKDSKGVWTWGIGVTDGSGHKVSRYKDNPQPLDHVLRVYLWLLREKYIPGVVKAFEGFVLTETQFAAALSFHYNTGAILTAQWVQRVKAGDRTGARRSIMDWKRPAEIIPRREKERDLFFDGKWSQDGKACLLGVRKPSYQPDWKSAKRIDVAAPLTAAMAA